MREIAPASSAPSSARAVAAGTTRRTNTRVTSVTRDNRNWRLQLDDGSAIDCAFLIDATGRASWLALATEALSEIERGETTEL